METGKSQLVPSLIRDRITLIKRATGLESLQNMGLAHGESSAEGEAEGAAFEARPSHPPSTPPRSTASILMTDGFLGEVARWKDADGSSRRVSTAKRTSRMIGSKVGISPPPPPGPPRTFWRFCLSSIWHVLTQKMW